MPISSEIPLADELRRIQLFTEIEFEYEMASEELFALRMLHIGRSLEQSDSLPILAESRRLLRARRPRTYIRLVALTLLGASNRNAATRPLNGSRVQPDLLQELLECLQEDGCASAVLPYCGNLIAKFKAKEMEIRNQVEVALRNCNCSNAPWSSGEALDLDRSRVGGYRLSPALESATTLVSAELIGYFFVYNFSDDVHRGQASLASAQRLAREYHPDAKLLFDAASAAVKGYEALVMAFAFAIHPDSERAHSHSLLRAAFEDGEWPHNGAVLVIVAVANWLAITGNASDDADAALAGFLAIKIMNFSPLNAGLLSALLTWREKSAAPVTKGGFDKLWLLQ